MKRLHHHFEIKVAGGRFASSAQPASSMSLRARPLSVPLTPQPFRSVLFLDTPGGMPKSLQCFTDFRPLLNALANVRTKLQRLLPRRIWE